MMYTAKGAKNVDDLFGVVTGAVDELRTCPLCA